MTRTKRRARIALTIATLAVASITLSGCLSAMIPDAKTPGTSGAERPSDTSGVSAKLLPYYEQKLTWESCGAGFDCTTVVAPLDWADPGAGDIELAVIRQRALGGEPIGSLLTNPGGPGASGVGLIRDSIDFAVGRDLQRNFDVIGFDPRGVGESTAVACFDAPEMDAYLFDIPAGKRNSPEWIAEVTESGRQFATACEANSDGILGYIDTLSAARDLDLLRGVLGDSKLNYLGYSYGTFLGATYAKLFPERVGRLVLDGAIDPSVPGIDVGTTQAVGFELALRAFMADCLGVRECAFNGSVDDAMADLGALLAAAERSPMRAADGRLVGAGTMLTGIIAALYSADSWGFLRGALAEALQGNPEHILILADFYHNREDGIYLDNSAEAFTAYNCMDYPIETDEAALAAAAAKVKQDAPTIAPYWVSDAPDLCESWPFPAVGERGPIHAPGAAPILVIGTTNDPATPYEWSVSLADQLESGVLITRVGEGHTGYNKGNACVDAAVETYLLTGKVPENGLRCG